MKINPIKNLSEKYQPIFDMMVEELSKLKHVDHVTSGMCITDPQILDFECFMTGKYKDLKIAFGMTLPHYTKADLENKITCYSFSNKDADGHWNLFYCDAGSIKDCIKVINDCYDEMLDDNVKKK